MSDFLHRVLEEHPETFFRRLPGGLNPAEQRPATSANAPKSFLSIVLTT
jgi:hypothetical protein